jgi:hypothetical protein
MGHVDYHVQGLSLIPANDLVTTANDLGDELLIRQVGDDKMDHRHRRDFFAVRTNSMKFGLLFPGCLSVGPALDVVFRTHERVAGRTTVGEPVGPPVDHAVVGLGSDFADERFLLVDIEPAHPDFAIVNRSRSSYSKWMAS